MCQFMRKYIRELTPGLILYILGMGVVFGCDRVDTQAAKRPAAESNLEAAQKENNNGSSSAQQKDVWPYITAQHNVALSDNLLARNFVLIFDGSGSMAEKQCTENETKLSVAKRAVREWLFSAPDGANLALVAFHDSKPELTVFDFAPGNQEKLAKQVGMFSAGGDTPLSHSFRVAYSLIERQAQRQLGYGEYTIVVITDGIARDPDELKGVVDALLTYTPVEVYTIGLCIGQHHSLNQPGRTTYKSAKNAEELRQGLKQVLAETEVFSQTEFDQ